MNFASYYLRYAVNFLFLLLITIIVSAAYPVNASICPGSDLITNDPVLKEQIKNITYEANATICVGNRRIICNDLIINDGWDYNELAPCPLLCANGDLKSPATRASCSGCTSSDGSRNIPEGQTFCDTTVQPPNMIVSKCETNGTVSKSTTVCPPNIPGNLRTCYDFADGVTDAKCLTPTPVPQDVTQTCDFNGTPIFRNQTRCNAGNSAVVTCLGPRDTCPPGGTKNGNLCEEQCNQGGVVGGGFPKVCAINASTNTAYCVIPSPTPSPTPTTAPSPTPPPDPNVTCTDGHKEGDIYCISSLTSNTVMRCSNNGTNNGVTETLGYCGLTLGVFGVCRTSLPPGEPVENICTTGSFVQAITGGGYSCNPTDRSGQINPQLGSNCGIPKETAIQVDDGAGNIVYTVDENHPYHKCCFANVNGIDDSLRCAVDSDLPGIDILWDWLTDWVTPLIDRLPFILDSSPQALNVGNIRNALKKIPACQSNAVTIGGKKAEDPDCRCELKQKAPKGVNYLCDKVSDNERQTCINCLNPVKDGGRGGVWTGLGCVVVENESGFIGTVLGLGIGIGGATSLLCLMYAAFLYQTSRGSTESLKKAQDLIVSCLTGLLMIIFSIFILRLIGYTILRIPGFG